jgi:hypothetical protein
MRDVAAGDRVRNLSPWLPYTPGEERRFYLGLLAYMPASLAFWAFLVWVVLSSF